MPGTTGIPVVSQFVVMESTAVNIVADLETTAEKDGVVWNGYHRLNGVLRNAGSNTAVSKLTMLSEVSQ